MIFVLANQVGDMLAPLDTAVALPAFLYIYTDVNTMLWSPALFRAGWLFELRANSLFDRIDRMIPNKYPTRS